mgnify:CR=1 FL=1
MSINFTNMMNNASFNIMQNSNSRLGMIGSAKPGSNMSIFSKKESALQISNLKNQTIFKAAQAMEESQKRIQDEKIKRTYSIFN